tara:strand:+ start:144086 stop:145282 length:1197 start_codon:yes stop_codon:yes gene_type:complete
MNFKTRPAVALHVESSRAYGRELLQGVALYARTRGNWTLLHQEMSLDSELPAWIRNSSVSGVIARVDTHTVDALRELQVPIVDVRCHRQFAGIPQVDTDNHRVAELAFEHLWDRGFRSFAWCGYQFATYSDERLKAFREFVTNSGHPLSVYQSRSELNTSLTTIEQSGITDVEPLSRWLTSLDRPTGLFVCNDIRGQQVLNVCRRLEIAVPDDIAVIGVDDDEAVCQLSTPPLSSVRPDAASVGYRAAEILDGMMQGIMAPHDKETISPTGVVERLSTQVVAVADRELARVCRFIRENACRDIKVGDIIQFSSLSRRQLERRFRDELGHTPHEEITAVQIRRVKQLLAETTMTLEQIAPLAGYKHKESLSAVFKRETGETPGDYRKKHAITVRDECPS